MDSVTSPPAPTPLYPMGMYAERAVRTLLVNSLDPYKALMSYRTTPLSPYGLSPAELLMGCLIRTDVPQVNCTKLVTPQSIWDADK